MTPDFLLQTAHQLRQPTATAAAEFEARRDALAELLNQRMGARPDLHRLIGPDNLSMMQDNSRNFCRFMSSLFGAYTPQVLVETVLWVFRAYRSHGFQTTYWAANLDTFLEILREQISAASYAELYPFFAWLITHIPIFVSISDAQLAQPLPEAPAHTHHE